MSTSTGYFIGDSLGQLGIWWTENKTLVDFSVSHTYSAVMWLDSDATKANVFGSAKTTGFAGAAGAGVEGPSGTPNLVVTWATSGELVAVTVPGLYILQITATRASDSRIRTLQRPIQMKAKG